MGSVVGNRRFRPSVIAVVLCTASAVGFFRLGVWQLDRAEHKRVLLAAFSNGTERAMRVTGELRGLARYQSIELSGRYDPQHQILLDNMPSARGQPGYRVLTPLQRDAGDWVLVDRGWVAAGQTRQQLPNIDVDGRVRIVRGQLDELPQPGIRLGSASQSGASAPITWPLVMNYPTHEELVATLERALNAQVVLLDRLQPDGYERIWQARFGFGPQRHLAYAIQWFGLLAAVMVTFVVVSFKKVADADGN